MSLENIYKNPFSDYNANFMDNEQITSFWESPFDKNICDITEKEFMSELMPVVFTGGRGTGKTMLLRHFELTSEMFRAKQAGQDLRQYIEEKGFVGIYIRFDSPLLSSFCGLNLEMCGWETIFTHFFELTLCKAFMDMLCKLKEEKIVMDNELNAIEQQICEFIQIDKIDLYSLLDWFRQQINYVNAYRSDLAIHPILFKPKTWFCANVSQEVVRIIKEKCALLKRINFLVLLDEYENFLEYEQKIVNSLIKFNHTYVMRIGMRPMGFHTFATVSENEFIKEHRDYRNIILGNPMIRKNNNYEKFLLGVATKRLSSIPFFKEKNMIHLEEFLGKKEDPVHEAIQIVNGRRTHIELYLKEIKKLYTSKKEEFTIEEKQLERLTFPHNPLYEMQNLRMLLKPFPIDYVIKAFTDYINGVESEEAKKYKNDYENKYKLAYVFVLRSIYKEECKQYYGTNDLAYLSSGIAGIFIELCRSVFQNAFFLAKEDLLNGKISSDIQTQAAREVGISEFEQIKRISQVGNYVSKFTNNIGNAFAEYHVDKRIRYPETNQVCIESDDFERNSIEEKTFKALVEWSVLQRKTNLQQSSIGKNNKEIYILNHIFAPIFNISARTRGGFNLELTADEFKEYINEWVDVKKQILLNKSEKAKQSILESMQLSLFNQGE